MALALVTESVSPLALTSDLAWAWQLVSRLALELAWAWQLVLTSALESQSVLELESYSELAWQSAWDWHCPYMRKHCLGHCWQRPYRSR